MNVHSSMKFFLPIIIVGVVLTSLFFSPKQINNQETKNIKVDGAVVIENKKTIPNNPTPENIQILGVQDIVTQTQNEEVNFDTNIIYGLISSYRKENGLNKLFINKLLENSAQKKLTDMIEKDYFRHADINNNESWYLFNAVGYQYKLAGENLSSGYNTPWQVFSAWQNSNLHNQQLLKSEYLDMGLAANCEVYEIKNKPACIVVLHLGVR